MFTVESTTVSTEDVNIELAKGNTLPLTQIAGFHVPKYDGTHVGGIGFDASGYAYVGDMVKNQDGTLSRGDAQEFATRSDHGEWDFDGEIPVWDATGKKFKPSGKGTSDIANLATRMDEAEATIYAPFEIVSLGNGRFKFTSTRRLVQVSTGRYKIVTV